MKDEDENQETMQIEDLKRDEIFSDILIEDEDGAEDSSAEESNPTMLLENVDIETFNDDEENTNILEGIDSENLDENDEDEGQTIVLENIEKSALHTGINLDSDDTDQSTVVLADINLEDDSDEDFETGILEDIDSEQFRESEEDLSIEDDSGEIINLSLDEDDEDEDEAVEDVKVGAEDGDNGGFENVEPQLGDLTGDTVHKLDPQSKRSKDEDQLDQQNKLQKLVVEDKFEDTYEGDNKVPAHESEVSISQSEISLDFNNEQTIEEILDDNISFKTEKKIPEELEFDNDYKDSEPLDDSFRFDENKLIHSKSVIKQMRLERDKILKELKSQKIENTSHERDILGYRAQLDEANIEITLLKNHSSKDILELKYGLKLAEDKKNMAEQKLKHYQKEFDKLAQQTRMNLNQVKSKEQDLESKLELLKMDAQAQLKGRENKISELQRKIDALEFNMENMSIQEQMAKEDKIKIEEKLNNILRALRSSMNQLETDDDIEALFGKMND